MDMIPQPMDGSLNLSAADQVSFNLNQFDLNSLRSENKILKSKIKQLQSDLLTEQDVVASVRKKLNNSERDRIDSVAKANEEVSRLDSETTKLRAQLEKGEAVRQNLEYELSKARRDINKEKRNVSERDCLITEVNDTMKQRVEELTKQVESLCDELEGNKLKHNEDLRRLKTDMEDKDSEMGKMKADIDGVENEKVKLESALTQSDETIRELEDRLQELDEEKRLQTDELRRQITELDLIREQQDQLKKDYEAACGRVRSLEESIEAERAAHLESKFNSEIIQLRLRDLENALDLEKSTKIEAFASTEKLNRQLRDLQQIYDEERKLSLETKEKLEKRWMPILRAEKEYAALSRQLNKELEEKRTVISNLSKQMEEHQRESTELKQELAKAKRKQMTVEETYSGCMKELDLLYENFKLDQTGKKVTMRKKVTDRKGGPGKAPQPNVVMDNLRHTLIDYSKRLEETATELKKEKGQHESVEKECKKQKDMIYAKDKALQTAQNGVTRSSKELRQLQTENKGLDKAVKQLTEDLDLLHKQVQKEKKQNLDLAQQCATLINTTKVDEKKTSEFIYHLYHQLSTDVPHTEKRDIQKCTFDDATNAINEQVSRLLNSCRWMGEKIKHLEATVVNKEDLVQQMQRAHEEQLEKLASIAEGRSQQWVQQKADMEIHYSKLLEEIHSRHKKTQAMADQAWEKVRSTGTVQQSLEKECDMLRKQLLHAQDQQQCLHAACALLCGALYPLYQRNQALATQRNILQEQADRFDHFKYEVQKLVEALSLDNISSGSSTSAGANRAGKEGGMTSQLRSRDSKTPLLRLRAGAVAVLAAHRLLKLRQNQRKMFVARDIVPGVESVVVYTGQGEEEHRRYSGVSGQPSTAPSVVDWLSSSSLLSLITASMGDVISAMHKARNGDRGYDQHKVVHAVRTSFQKLMFHLPTTFPSATADSAVSGFRERGSLLRVLSQGLNRVLSNCSSQGAVPSMEASPQVLSSLQKHMLEFTQRLHTAEVERRDLRIQVSQLQQDSKRHTDNSIEAERMVKELHFLRQQVENTVERGRFDEMCKELNRALQREQEAQQLLNEQSQQIRELGVRLDLHMSKGSEKEQTINEAVQGLSEAKMEVKRQEQRVRQLTRQVSQAEGENGRLSENVRDAESALRTAAKDREALLMYMKTVEKILEQVQSQQLVHVNPGTSLELSRLVAADLVPANLSKIGPELVACQSLVASFVDSQKQLCGQVTVLHGEIDQHKTHIATLKREISAACRREYQDEFDKIKLRDGMPEEPMSPSRPVIGSSLNGQRVFAPLEEDLNDVYGLHSPGSPKAPHTAKTKHTRYQSPPTKAAGMKRRPAEGGERR